MSSLSFKFTSYIKGVESAENVGGVKHAKRRKGLVNFFKLIFIDLAHCASAGKMTHKEVAFFHY